MSKKYPKPSSEWPPYPETLQSPSFSEKEFARISQWVESELKRDESFQSLSTEAKATKLRRTALISVAGFKRDALFAHFGINPGQPKSWQLLALHLAAHHVPGCMPTAPDDEGRPSYDSHVVVEVFLEAKRRRKMLKSQGVPPTEASQQAMSWVKRNYGKRWTELKEMKFSSLKRRYHESIDKFAQLPSIGDVNPPPRTRSKK
jgi:hypothetical protein